MAIPKILHYFWHDGFDTMPEAYRYFLEHARDLHPGWEIRFWDKTNLPEIRNRELFDAQRWWTYKSTILRYQLLEDHGGIWVDVDALLLKSLEPLIDRDYFVFQSRVGFLCSWCFGTEPGHPFVKHLNRSISERAKSFPDTDEGAYCAMDGPAMVDAAVESGSNMDFMPPEAFIHYSHSNKCPEDERMAVQIDKMRSNPDAFVMHFMNHKNHGEGVVLHKILPSYLRASLQIG